MKQVQAIQKLRSRIEAIMHDRADASRGSWAALLLVLSKVYGAGVAARARWYQRSRWSAAKLPCGVVSIGNITVGGTGKTPMTAFVAQEAQARGYSVAILSRGYRGRAEQRGGVVSDGKRLFMGPREAGDEPFMLARQLPGVAVAVGRDRGRSGRRLWQRYRPDLMVLDDGFQHQALFRDLDIVLLDYRRPLGNGFLLPRGVLREPLSALERADAIVLTHAPEKGAAAPVWHHYGGPVFFSHCTSEIQDVVLAPQTAAAPGASDQRYSPGEIGGAARMFAFAGVADNEGFFDSLRASGMQLAGTISFPDHHWYRQPDVAHIWRGAEQCGAERLVTTAKDYVRFADRVRWPLDLVVMGLKVQVSATAPRFDAYLAQQLAQIVDAQKGAHG
jgi:tetraacyldisaccharide 4'-kinase